jgi:hypothetical protein
VSFSHPIFLFLAAFVAGALNSVAGGGSFISFPALLFSGVAPIAANATNTAAVWPGAVASTPGASNTYNRTLTAVVRKNSIHVSNLTQIKLFEQPQISLMRESEVQIENSRLR